MVQKLIPRKLNDVIPVYPAIDHGYAQAFNEQQGGEWDVELEAFARRGVGLGQANKWRINNFFWILFCNLIKF